MSAGGYPGSERRQPGVDVATAYIAHRSELYAHLLAATRDPQLAEDLVQEAFVRLTCEIHRGRVPDNVAGWLHRVGMNLVVSNARRAKVAERCSTRVAADAGITIAEASVEAEAVARETGRSLVEAVNALEDTDRTVVLMALEGRSGAQIAAVIGGTEGAARTRLCRARVRLRHTLAPSLAS